MRLTDGKRGRVAEEASNEKLYRPQGMWPVACLYRPVISVTRWMHGMDGRLTDNDDDFLLYGENVK